MTARRSQPAGEGSARMAELARRPSATRGASIARARRRSEAMRGSKRSTLHGVFAIVAAAEDVASELDLLAVAFPNLDPIADGRLMELLAIARVSVARSFLALAEPMASGPPS
jgi:hypothetical protein